MYNKWLEATVSCSILQGQSWSRGNVIRLVPGAEEMIGLQCLLQQTRRLGQKFPEGRYGILLQRLRYLARFLPFFLGVLIERIGLGSGGVRYHPKKQGGF